MNLQAKSFVDENGKNLAKLGLSHPFSTVTLTTSKDNKKLTLLFGKANKKFYAKRGEKPVVYEVDKDVFDKLAQPSNSYRSLALAKFNRFKVERIKLERESGGLELEKKQSDWKIVSDPQLKVDTTKVEALLTKIQDIKISKYLPDKSQSFKKSDLIMRLYETDGGKEKEKLNLKFGKRQNKEVTAENSDYSALFTIKDTDFESINVAKQNFVKVEEKKAEKKDDKKDSAKKTEKKAG